MKHLIIILALFFTLPAWGQRLPNQFPLKSSAEGTDELYTQASGVAYRIKLDTVRLFMSADIDLTPLAYNIDSTGANIVDSLRGRFVIDLSGDWWYVDKDKKAVLIGASETGQANTGANVGDGEGVFYQKSGVQLQFKSLKVGGINSIASTDTTITITGTEADGSTTNELGSVSVITNVPDTTSLTPKAGDMFVNAAKDTMGIYATYWVLFFGGSPGDNLGDHTATQNLNMDGNTILGGTGTTDDLILQSTSGVGGTTSEILFNVGNAGGTEAMRIRGDGKVGVNQSTPAQTLHVQGTARITGSDGTGTRVMLRDADGDISDATLGVGITLSGGELASTLTVSDLTDTDVPSPATGKVLKYNASSGKWEAGNDNTGTSIGNFDVIATGQSNMVNRDTSVGTWTYEVNSHILAWDYAADTFAVANPALNNITPEDQTGERNNIAFQFARRYFAANPNDTVRLVVRAVGGQASYYWTPEIESAPYDNNNMLDKMIAELDAVPTDFDAKAIIWHQGENDISVDEAGYLNRIISIYDTLTSHPRVNNNAVMILGSLIDTLPWNAYETILDSIYYRLKDVQGRNIVAAPYSINDGIDNLHFTNEAIDNIGLFYFSAYQAGWAGVRQPEAAKWSEVITGLGHIYRNGNVVVGDTSKIDDHMLNVIIPPERPTLAKAFLATRQLTGADGRQQSIDISLSNDATNGAYIEHSSETSGTRTAKNRLRFTDTNIAMEGSGTTDIANWSTSAINHYQPTAMTSVTASTVTTTGKVESFETLTKLSGDGTPLVIQRTSGGGDGIYTGAQFKVSSVNVGQIRGILRTGPNGGDMAFLTDLGFSTLTERMRLTRQGRLGIGVTTPTAILHLPAGTATANTAPMKFEAGTSLTTPEAGAMEFDGTNYFATASTTRYILAKTLTATAALDFASTSAQSSADLTITVTGAALGDAVHVGVPNGSVTANTCFTGWVSAADTVTIRFNNYSSGAVDPASGTFRAVVTKY